MLSDCIHANCRVLHANGVAADHSALFEKAQLLNREREDLRVWPLHERLAQMIEGAATISDHQQMRELV